MGYGCKHYRRRCKIRAPCCDEIYACRHCHNEAASLLRNPYDRHELVRQDIKQVVCAVCETEQPIVKQQFHCDDCGICRIGGQENYFHCEKCGTCYSVTLRDNHVCVENSMRHHCPICYEFLFDSMKVTMVMQCGHTMHHECFVEIIKREKYCCPILADSIATIRQSVFSLYRKD